MAYNISRPSCGALAEKEGTHSTHFLFKDHSESERGNPLPPLRGLFFPISRKGSFICSPTDRIAHTIFFVTPVVEHWLEREIAQWRIDPTIHRTISERFYHGATSRSLCLGYVCNITPSPVDQMRSILNRRTSCKLMVQNVTN